MFLKTINISTKVEFYKTYFWKVPKDKILKLYLVYEYRKSKQYVRNNGFTEVLSLSFLRYSDWLKSICFTWMVVLKMIIWSFGLSWSTGIWLLLLAILISRSFKYLYYHSRLLDIIYITVYSIAHILHHHTGVFLPDSSSRQICG